MRCCNESDREKFVCTLGPGHLEDHEAHGGGLISTWLRGPAASPARTIVTDGGLSPEGLQTYKVLDVDAGGGVLRTRYCCDLRGVRFKCGECGAYHLNGDPHFFQPPAACAKNILRLGEPGSFYATVRSAVRAGEASGVEGAE